MSDFSLDYRYLKAFVTVAHELNFSKAAKELGIAQSAVSRQIKLLEESVQEQLIIRSSKKVLLTDKGQTLLHELQRFESKVDDIFFTHMNKTIRVGILHGLLETWFNPIMVEFLRKSSHQLKIEVGGLEDLKEKLYAGKYDLIFTTENLQSDLITSLKLFEEKMVIVSKKEINFKEAWEYPWIVYSEQDELFQLFKKHSQKIIVVNSMTTILKLVGQGMGIAIVPDHTVGKDQQIKSYDLKGLPRHHIHLASLNYKHMPEHIQELVDLIKLRQ